MKKIFKKLLPFMGLLLFSCSPENLTDGNETITNSDSNDSGISNANNSRVSNTNTSKIWNFDTLTEWEDATQVGNPNYWIESGNLHIFTNPNTWERSKVKTISSFTAGTYTWKVFIPEMGVGDMASIGAFLYNNDTHELDFEIGYGNQAIRNQLEADPDDLIAYMTSQANPFQSFKKKIKRGQWYTLSLELTLNSSRKYHVNWKINGELTGATQLTYGDKTKFKIFCSIENLTFIGDHIPNIQNYALFDSVEFKSN
ncbi:hypothetical protein [Flavobacterium rhamnosiphilum]|uniref:hypothetical protein n=1 Tax=Flavobacterium rhamnosiphilum TaxID=2541724 RepID=UPI001F300A24|nr:hypothetical protein [Flavobacterium rhamnosiphilum]